MKGGYAVGAFKIGRSRDVKVSYLNLLPME